MKKISFGTLKGGTGKTMTLFSIAGVLAEDSKVLMVDCDPQSNLTSNAGVDIANFDLPSLRTVFENRDTEPHSVIVKAPIAALPNLDIIPSSIYLHVTERDLASRGGREHFLSNWFKRHESVLSKYDYVLFDTNPSMGLVNQNAFSFSDSIILVTDVGYNALDGVQAFIFLWDLYREDLELEDNINALIVNNLDKRIGLSADFVDEINEDEELSKLIITPTIPARVALKNTELDSVPVTVSEPKSDAALAIRELTKNLIKRGVL